MYATFDKKIIEDNQPYTDSQGIKYPANFPKDKISELYKVTETPIAENALVNGFYIDDDFTQIWNVREKSEKELLAEITNEAVLALDKSDMVAIRCIKAGIAFPDEWKIYVEALRDVINGNSTTLPETPLYPEGS